MTAPGSATIFALSSALGWGAGDFCGGLASQRSSVFAVLFVAQTVGGLLLTLLALLLWTGPPDLATLLPGAAAGLFGLAGLLFLYRGLSMGRMSLVAPLAALVAVILPILFSIFTEGPPTATQIVGFGLALFSIWLISFSGVRIQAEQQALLLALLAGSLFGLFFVLIGSVARDAVLWPVIAARWSAVVVLVAFCILRREALLPSRGRIPLMGLAGMLDTAGNACFALAARAGRLDISVVLASLYPAVTVLLAFLLLKERLSLRQWTGVLFALTAIALIAF